MYPTWKYYISFVILAFFFLMLFPKNSLASEQFLERYDVSYDISESGETLVTEKVTIENLSDAFFGTEYTSIIPANQITELLAYDANGSLRVEEKDAGAKKMITVHFSEQVIGKGKEYSWTLKFKSKDFVVRNGLVWQVLIPKIGNIANLEQYNVTLSVPLIFGDPAIIEPKPNRQSDAGSQVDYFYTKEILGNSGISSYFGKQQYYDFGLTYKIKNESLLPQLKSILLPANGIFQEVLIDSIDPKPETVVRDKNGNSFAVFNLKRLEEKEVRVLGKAKLDLDKKEVELPAIDQLESSKVASAIWDGNSGEVKSALKEAIGDGANLTEEQKARKIYDYVTKVLAFGDLASATMPLANNSASYILNQNGGPQNGKTALYCRDFVNVTIAMLRAAGIAAQQVVGFADSTNRTIRPSCFIDKNMHSWARFYDSRKGWLSMDPVWGATSGMDYSSVNDLSHITLGFLENANFDESIFPIKNELKLTNREFIPNYSIEPVITTPSEMIAGFPYNVSFEIRNNGNSVLPAGSVYFSAGKLKVASENVYLGNEEYSYPEILPYGSILYSFKVKTATPFEAYKEKLVLKFNGKEVVKEIEVKTFFAAPLFSFGIFSFLGMMFLLYILAIVLHYKTPFEELGRVVKKEILLLPAPKEIKKQKGKRKKKQKTG